MSTFYYTSIRSFSLGAHFWYGFSILVALSLSLLHTTIYDNITTGGSDSREVGINTQNKLRVCVCQTFNLLFFQNDEGICIQ